MTTKQKPWTNKNGKPLSDYKLKCVSQNWSKNTWEAYANSIESFQKEMPLNKAEDYDNYLQAEISDFYGDSSKRKRTPLFKKYMHFFVKELSERQQVALVMIFWQRMSLIEVANSMNINSSSVLKLRERALKDLSEKFVNIALKIYQKEKNLPYLKLDGIQAREDKRYLKSQLQSACARWTPQIWERYLPYIEEEKPLYEEVHKREFGKKNKIDIEI